MEAYYPLTTQNNAFVVKISKQNRYIPKGVQYIQNEELH